MTGGNGSDFVRITNREIWETLNVVRDEVRDVKNICTNIEEENVELRRRVRALELKVYTILAGLTTGATAGAVVLVRAMGGTA